MKTFATQVIEFHKNIRLNKELPLGIKVMNPYQDNPAIHAPFEHFYQTFFDDHKTRKLIVGINPGRLGAGATGIPFTDTKRLVQYTGLTDMPFQTHEPSSVFVYELIEAYGGAQQFYDDFYINSVCPLGFIRKNKKNNWVNCNYYDYKSLYQAVKPFIISSLKQQIHFGVDTTVCYSMGKKNAKFLETINQEERLFEKIIALPHPRYIVQYKSKYKTDYINDYLKVFAGA